MPHKCLYGVQESNPCKMWSVLTSCVKWFGSVGHVFKVGRHNMSPGKHNVGVPIYGHLEITSLPNVNSVLGGKNTPPPLRAKYPCKHWMGNHLAVDHPLEACT